MGGNYYIYDNEEKEFWSVSFADFEAAKSYVENSLKDDWERYAIFQKMSLCDYQKILYRKPFFENFSVILYMYETMRLI